MEEVASDLQVGSENMGMSQVMGQPSKRALSFPRKNNYFTFGEANKLHSYFQAASQGSFLRSSTKICG